ncbi:10039_t:CDS:2 [Entrophospora sp. SA101]|nr:10039_t:CDS:2 [Entrophospora sp. SA101]
MTPGITPERLDGLSAEWIDETIKALRDESFQFRPITYIPNKSGGMRAVRIASPRDKLVQEAMRLILEAIFEPTETLWEELSKSSVNNINSFYLRKNWSEKGYELENRRDYNYDDNHSDYDPLE